MRGICLVHHDHYHIVGNQMGIQLHLYKLVFLGMELDTAVIILKRLEGLLNSPA